MAVEFAKYGFYGTLVASLAGMVFIGFLALLEGLTKFKLSTEYVGLALVICIAAVGFGSLSLWMLPRIVATILGMKVVFGDAQEPKEAEPKKPE
jgi:hypothetical protein